MDHCLWLALALSVGSTVPDDERVATRDRGVRADREAVLESREEAIIDTLIELEECVEDFGGLEAMYDAVEPAREEIRQILRATSFGGRTLPIAENLQGILQAAPERYEPDALGPRDPVQVIIAFDRLLKQRDIDLIVVPVPAKIELLVDDLETELDGQPLSPGRIDAMLTLLEADVEVVDILPTMQAVQGDAPVPLYERNGHHPSGYGAKVAGELVAERLLRYDFEGADPDRFVEARRNATERVDRSVSMKAWQVRHRDRDEPYEHVPDAPVVVIGDSHAFAYSTASWASHIARNLGLPISDISESSGGARAHDKLARQGIERLDGRQVVIWIFTSVMLFGGGGWDETPLYEEPVAEDVALVNQVREQLAQYHEEKHADPEGVRVEEARLNQVGYDLIAVDQIDLAIEVFEVAIELYPASANAHDSLGEAFFRAGRKEDAIWALRKCLALAPNPAAKANSLRILGELGVEVESEGDDGDGEDEEREDEGRTHDG